MNFMLRLAAMRYQNHGEVIELLCKLYPKCFFVNPRQRRPMKRNIVEDIERAREPSLVGFDVGAAVDWYEGHIGYDYALVAGADRMDLEGGIVGKITKAEENEAHARIAVKRKQIKESKQIKERDVLKTMQALYSTGCMTDDQMGKVTAPPLPKPAPISEEQKLDNIIAAVTEARELLSFAQTDLRELLARADAKKASAFPRQPSSQFE
jgi:sRNA-binding protein